MEKVFSLKRSGQQLILSANFFNEKWMLVLDLTKCVYCNLCVVGSPVDDEPIRITKNIHGEKIVDMKYNPVLFSGYSVVLCPFNAFSLTKNGEPQVPAITEKALPQYKRGVKIDRSRCDLCGLCATRCPTRAIHVDKSKIEVKEKDCLGCKWCEVICPKSAIKAMKFIQGYVELDADKCRGAKECGNCVEACPIGALNINKIGHVDINNTLCIHCGACEVSCPTQAIKVVRTRIAVEGSATPSWDMILEKLTSREQRVKDMRKRSYKRSLKYVQATIGGEM